MNAPPIMVFTDITRTNIQKLGKSASHRSRIMPRPAISRAATSARQMALARTSRPLRLFRIHLIFLFIYASTTGESPSRVGKNVHPDIFLILLFDSHVYFCIKKKEKLYFYIFLFILMHHRGVAEPRRENCPPGQFSYPPFRLPCIFLHKKKKNYISIFFSLFWCTTGESNPGPSD